MTRKLLSIVALVLLCFGSVVFAAQNTNSSRTQNGNMGNMNMGGRRHRRHRHKKHRHVPKKMKSAAPNTNM
ncbi:MAG: hypothetical protein M3R69_16850 [Acidobacteriota bacterium]|nr:hypothetical protein [Acidobacteriota bacterium]